MNPLPGVPAAENALTGRRVPVQFALVLTPLGYASLGYAIVKHDLWDIDRIVRRTFAYVLVSMIVLAGYAGLLEASLRWMPAIGSEGQTLLGMGFVLALAVFLDPLRGAVQSVVDSAFFRRRLDYRATIRELSAVMTTLLDLREIIAQVTRVVTDGMQLESMTTGLTAEHGRSVVWQRSAEGELQSSDAGREVVALAGAAIQAPIADVRAVTGQIDDPVERAAAQALIVATRAQLVIPVSFQGTSIGVLLLGSRRSGLPLESEAIDLLRTLADQSAIAVQNAHAHAALEALNRDLDAQVRVRTRELREAYDELKSAQAQLIQSEKMASLGQLVAGVAHELNNPASFLYAGLENIEESVGRLRTVLQAYEAIPVSDPAVRAHLDDVREREQLASVLQELPGLLSISGEGLDRIKRIVDDLRVFARADSGERVRTDVVKGIEASLRLLGNQLSRSRIRVVVEAEPQLPTIEANASQLNQVWMNLLSNAIDAVSERREPEIRVGVRLIAVQDSARVLEVEIKDNGRGVEATHLRRLFEPFFTTKPIGQGTGLGLSIAYGAVKAHGGTIEIESEPGGGTRVSVRLPAEEPTPPPTPEARRVAEAVRREA